MVKEAVDEAFDLPGPHLGWKTMGIYRNWKHCAICGQPIQSDISKLLRHRMANHRGARNDNVEEEGFLLRNCLPSNSKYSNFAEYMQNKETVLRESIFTAITRARRRSKPKHADIADSDEGITDEYNY